MNVLFNIIIFSLVLGIIVLIHELGHLLAAKRYGVYCHEFAIGMGPTVFKFKKPEWETTYSLRLFPIGGFVAMAGEDEPREDVDVPFERTLPGVKAWKRLVIMLSGIVMNMVLAFLIFWGMSTVLGTVETPKAIIAEVQVNSAADQAGLQAGDTIKSFKFHDGTELVAENFNDIFIALATYGEYGFDVTVDRNGSLESLRIEPEWNAQEERYLLGVMAPPAEHKSLNILSAIPVAFMQIKDVIVQFAFIITRLFRGIGLDAVGGPIGIFEVTSQVQVQGAISISAGFVFFLNLVALLSVNLGVVNLIPIPVMDGGRALLTLVEMLMGKPINKKLENAIMLIGLLMMIALFVFIMGNDIRKLF